MAVLIDGDNAQASLLNKMLAEIAKHGSVTIRRIYGDWTTSNMNSWKDALHLHAVQPIQQFRYTVGKNATDSALIIDAMDIMHRRWSRASASSPRTATTPAWPRASARRASSSWASARRRRPSRSSTPATCSSIPRTWRRGARTSRARSGATAAPRQQPQGGTAARNSQQPALYAGTDPMPLLREAYEMVVQENGWANLGPMGKALLQLDPGFDPRSFGQRQLSSLIKSLPDFEIRRSDDHSHTGVWVRLKE